MKISPILLGLSLAVTGSFVAAAQEASTSTPPQILQITREFVKAGKAGQLHDKSEAAFVSAMARAKSPTHYVALTSLSGKSRALYITPYASFDAWEKDVASQTKNATLSAELERASVADGELLDSLDQAICHFSSELSYKPKSDLSQARYLEVSVFHVKPGHGEEFNELVKMVIAGHEKAGTSAHWATFHIMYGREGGSYLVLSSDHSMSEIDNGFADDKKFGEAMGKDGLKKLDQLFASSVDTSDNELFAVNPRQSYVDESWTKADPDFWKPKSTDMASAKQAAKQAAAAAAKTASATPKPASR